MPANDASMQPGKSIPANDEFVVSDCADDLAASTMRIISFGSAAKMQTAILKRLACGAALLCAMLAGSARAAVTSAELTIPTLPGFATNIPLDIDSTDIVAGINGQLNYDPNVFSNPRLVEGPGAPGFIAADNIVAPGQYRFVVYSNPTAAMNLGANVISIYIDHNLFNAPSSATLSYSLEAASDPSGNSLPDVAFGDVTVVRRAAATDWLLYR